MYPVDLHTHTVASTHAYSTLSDYITEVHCKGIGLSAITDHGPDMADVPHHRRFTNTRAWPYAVDSVGILRGIETNTKNIGGGTDCSGPMFTSLDLVIAGFHKPVFAPHDKGISTQVMIATVASGSVHIVSHPGSPKYPVDIKAVTKAAARCQVMLEINNSSFLHSRKGNEDNCRAIATAVRSAGGWVALGSDSYIVFTLGEFGECRKILDGVNFPEDKILNVIPKRLLALPESRDMEPIAELAEL